MNTAKDLCKQALLASLLLVFVACSSVGPRPAHDTASADESIELLEQSAAGNAAIVEREQALAAALAEALMPAEAAEAEIEDRFDLSVDAVSAQNFFRGLVRDTDYNIVVHPQVTGDVSLDLKDVSVPDVMEIMRDVYGYDYTRVGRLLQVYPDALRTEIFQVDYLNVERSGHSEMQVSAGRVSDANDNSGGGSGSNQSGGYDNSGGRSSGGRGGDVVGTLVNTDARSNFWAELQETLASMVADDEGSQVVVTPQVGLVVVRAMPDSLYAVRSYLGQVENTLHRQVILEAKIVEVTLREGFQMGINWNTFGEGSGGTFRPETTVDANGNVITTRGSGSSTDAELLFNGVDNFFNPLGTAFTLSGSYGDFEAAIELLETQGTVQVLSSPRIATVNNQKAVIKVGSDEFFVTDISTDTITAGSAINTNESPELTPFFSGIALDVTPQISDEGRVILHIHPTVSQVEEQLKNIAGEDVPLASSTIRESDSIVRASDGQIVVIGGLMQNSSADADGGVPGFSSLPGVGYLFKSKQQTSVKSELVILLKPIVVKGDEHGDAMRKSLEHIKSLRESLGRRG